MKIKENKITTKNNELLSTKTDLKVVKLPTNYMENLKKSVAGMITALDKPGVREGLLAEAQRLNTIEERNQRNRDINRVKREILFKPYMTDKQSNRLKAKTDELEFQGDLEGLEQLNKGIDFSEKGGLILHTSVGDLKFAPKQATFADVMDIPGIKEGKNVWRKDDLHTLGEIGGLYANFDAIKKLKKAGKKICTEKQFLAAMNIFPGGKELHGKEMTTKVNDFFDLLGVKNKGYRDVNGNWWDTSRFLRSSTGYFTGNARGIVSNTLDGNFKFASKGHAFGIWFLE